MLNKDIGEVVELRFPNDPIKNCTDKSNFEKEFAKDLKWLIDNKNSGPFGYCISMAKFKLDVFSERAHSTGFWGQSLAHAQLILTVGSNALEAIQQGSTAVGTPLSECYHAMNYDVSTSTKRRIIKEAIDRDYLRETLSEWNNAIKLIYPTGFQLRLFMRQQYGCRTYAHNNNMPKHNRACDVEDPCDTAIEIMSDEFAETDY